jgi:hypothetical protein
MTSMWLARLVCSDESCAQELDVYAARLEELERLGCDCGCAMQILGWADAVEDADAYAVVLAAAT